MPFDLLRIPIFGLSIADLDRLLRRPDDGLRRPALLLPGRDGPQRGGDRPADDALAAGGGDRRARSPGASPTAIGPAPWAASAWRCSPSGLGLLSLIRPGDVEPRHRLAHGGLRPGLRLLPVAQQPRHGHLRAHAPQRRGRRGAGHRAPARPDGRARSPRRCSSTWPGPTPRRARWPPPRRLAGARRAGQPVAPEARAAAAAGAARPRSIRPA